MDSPITTRSINLCKLFTLNCDWCDYPRSRRDGLVAEIRGVSRFICALCSKTTGAAYYSDVFGRSDVGIMDWIFGTGEGAT